MTGKLELTVILQRNIQIGYISLTSSLSIQYTFYPTSTWQLIYSWYDSSMLMRNQSDECANTDCHNKKNLIIGMENSGNQNWHGNKNLISNFSCLQNIWQENMGIKIF